jgi:hypothetical protein
MRESLERRGFDAENKVSTEGGECREKYSWLMTTRLFVMF